MDDPSRNVIMFLESLQDAMSDLGRVTNHYRKRGTRPSRPVLSLSGRPFFIHDDTSKRSFQGNVILGFQVTGSDNRVYEMSVEVLWDSEHWTITTQISLETDRGFEVLRELPERTVGDLRSCIDHLHAAIGELVTFDDLIPDKAQR